MSCRSTPPEIQRLVLGEASEVSVRRQHGEIVTDAELREESVDRPDSDAAPAAGIAQGGCRDVVFPVGHEEGEGGEALDDAISRARPMEALKKFLENEARGEDGLADLQCPRQGGHLGARIL